jgi:hypothetical protein
MASASFALTADGLAAIYALSARSCLTPLLRLLDSSHPLACASVDELADL